MRISTSACYGAVIALLGLMSSYALAVVEVLEAQGNLDHWVVYDSRHSPCVGVSWSHAVDEDVAFDIQAASDDESCVGSNWTGRCDANGFLYTGEIMPVTEGNLGWWIYLQSRISVLIDLTTPTRITACRTVGGMLSPLLHTVSVVDPDGSTDILLGPDSAADSAERILGPGVHRVTFSIESEAVWDIHFRYSGLVEVKWETPVRADTRTWGGIKCLYRTGR